MIDVGLKRGPCCELVVCRPPLPIRDCLLGGVVWVEVIGRLNCSSFAVELMVAMMGRSDASMVDFSCGRNFVLLVFLKMHVMVGSIIPSRRLKKMPMQSGKMRFTRSEIILSSLRNWSGTWIGVNFMIFSYRSPASS